MPRIDPVDSPDAVQTALLGKSLPGPDGQPLAVFKTLVRWPELMRRVNALGGYFLVHGGLAARERELAILRTASLAASEYELGQHRWLAATLLSPGEIAGAGDPRRAYAWNTRDDVMLRVVDEVFMTDTVSPERWSAASEHFDKREMVELLVLVGFYRMLAGVLNGLGVELDDSVRAVLEEPHPAQEPTD